MTTYDAVAGLQLEIDAYELEGLTLDVSSGFTRRTTVVHLRGAGEEGVGEDPTYEESDQLAFQERGGELPLAGSHTLAGFSELLARLSLFPDGPTREVSEQYRRWAFESAALDLALRQAGGSLADTVGREPGPVEFVVSMRLGEPPSLDRVRSLLAAYPGIGLKLDPTSSWTKEIVAELAATGAVAAVDLKGTYTDVFVAQAADPVLYRLMVDAFPQAWIEDPALTPETEPILAPHRDRIAWDEPIHSVADVQALPFPPRTLNVKPSRFGSLRALFDAYDYFAETGIGAYGGGQFELGPGRGQLQYLASLFHPEAPNDVAPGGFNELRVPAGLPTSPLRPSPARAGFRWHSG